MVLLLHQGCSFRLQLWRFHSFGSHSSQAFDAKRRINVIAFWIEWCNSKVLKCDAFPFHAEEYCYFKSSYTCICGVFSYQSHNQSPTAEFEIESYLIFLHGLVCKYKCSHTQTTFTRIDGFRLPRKGIEKISSKHLLGSRWYKIFFEYNLIIDSCYIWWWKVRLFIYSR